MQAKETISEEKRQPSEWEKILKKKKMKKWTEGLKRHISTEDTQMANKHEKMVSIADFQRNVSIIVQYFSAWATYVSQPREFGFFF